MREDLRQRILNSIDLQFGGKPTGQWLRKIACPSCRVKEAYTHLESPWVIKCARESKCGDEHHVKELFPELFNDWTRDYPTTPHNPHAAADAYLTQGRGFNTQIIKGWYTQGAHHDREIDEWTATAKFTLTNGSTFDRFIDRPERFGKRKGTLGPYKGHWWQAPTGKFSKLTETRELWLTEGIFNAIALFHADKFAVATLSSSHYPETNLNALAEACEKANIKRPTLIWALDSDHAGQKNTKIHIERAQNSGWKCKAAQAPIIKGKCIDWNDHMNMGHFNDAFFDKARYFGDLLLAPTALEKGKLINERKGKSRFTFDFNDELYWFELKESEKNEPAANSYNIATCVPKVLYKQSNHNTDEHWFYFMVRFPHAKPYKLAFSNAQIASAAEFKKRLLVAHGGLFTGKTSQLDAYIKNQMRYLKTVDTIDYIGYSKEYQMYILGDIAVKDGKTYKLNSEDFFECGNLSIKSLSNQKLKINDELSEFKSEFFHLIYKSFGAKGLVALSFWFGSFFAEQIRAEMESYPFLELIGVPGAGKSTLIAFLWRLCGRVGYEGFDPNKATISARGRNMTQHSNLPTVFLEADRSDDKHAKQGKFDWDELKTAYNGGTPRLTGQKNDGNGTNEPLFKGSIVISQNAVVKASSAILERIVHLSFDKKHFSPETAVSSHALTRLTVQDVSGFILKAISSEAKTMATITSQTFEHQKMLDSVGTLKNGRVIKNHAQVLACWSAMRLVFPNECTDEMHEAVINEVTEMAVCREIALEDDHPLVSQFWEVYEFFENTYEDKAIVNHSRNPQEIAINLLHFEQVAADRKVRIPLISEIRDLLRTSRRHKFIDVKSVGSVINKQFNIDNPINKRPETVKCWVFEK